MSLILHICDKWSLPGDTFRGRLSIPRVWVKVPEGLSTVVGEATSAAPLALLPQSLCGYFFPCRFSEMPSATCFSLQELSSAPESWVFRRPELVGPLDVSHLILGLPTCQILE